MLLFIFFSGSFWTKGGSATENSLRSRLTALDIHRKQLLVFFLFPADGRGFSGRSGQIAQRLEGQLSLFEFGAFAAVERSVALLAPLFERRIAQEMCIRDSVERTGYGLRKWIPALFGYVIDTPEETARFLNDWRRVVGNLFAENFFGNMARRAREQGLSISYETAAGDIFPADILEYYKYADVPM